VDINKVILAGHLTRDPELNNLPSSAVCNFTVAVNYRYKTTGGERKEEVAFVACVAQGNTADVVVRYFSKGKPILVEGRIKTESWEDGSGKRQHKTRVWVENIQFIDSKTGGC